jgi:hypothetical protein
MKYSVCYGVNNSHMCEAKIFSLYRDAKDFFEKLPKKFEAKVCFKLAYDKAGFVIDKEPKLYEFESGKDNRLMLEKLLF